MSLYTYKWVLLPSEKHYTFKNYYTNRNRIFLLKILLPDNELQFLQNEGIFIPFLLIAFSTNKAIAYLETFTQNKVINYTKLSNL